jgi:peptidoglycan hydrolase CwlO-like protein
MHKKMTQELETSQKEFETKLKKLNGQLETTNKSLNDTNGEVDNVVKGILIVINYRTGRQFEHH